MTAIIPASGHVNPERREVWRPRLKSGYFYIKDRQYYLYARKRTLYVGEARQLRQELAGMPVPGTMSVKIEGVPWTNWWIEGRDLVVSLEGSEGDAAYWGQLSWDITLWDLFKTSIEALPENQIWISYDYYDWNTAPAPTGQKFDIKSITQYFRIGDAEETHHLPDDWVPGAPVVITDDSRGIYDGRTHRVQFRVTEPKRTIEFNREDNLVSNPHFQRGVSGMPASWYLVSGAAWQQGTGYVGENYLYVPSGMAVQEVPATGEPIAIDAWVRGSGEARLELAYRHGSWIIDQSGNVIGTSPDFGLSSLQKTLTLTDEWARLSAVVGTGTEFDPTDALFPDICDAMEVRLARNSGHAEFGAVSVRYDSRSSLYNYVDPTGTIEYETDPSGFWQHRPSDRFPWEDEWEVDMNAVNEPSHAGFLVISEEGEPTDESIGMGAMTFEEAGAYGTDDYPQGVRPWPSGVHHEFGRRHLPYAKIRGYRKLRQTQTFDNENQPAQLFEVTEPRRPKEPKNIVLSSPASLYRDSGGLTWMVYWVNRNRREFVSAQFLDSEGNPLIHDWVDITAGISGFVVDPTGAYTDRAGRVVTAFSGQATAPLPSGQLVFTHAKSSKSASIWIHVES